MQYNNYQLFRNFLKTYKVRNRKSRYAKTKRRRSLEGVPREKAKIIQWTSINVKQQQNHLPLIL